MPASEREAEYKAAVLFDHSIAVYHGSAAKSYSGIKGSTVIPPAVSPKLGTVTPPAKMPKVCTESNAAFCVKLLDSKWVGQAKPPPRCAKYRPCTSIVYNCPMFTVAELGPICKGLRTCKPGCLCTGDKLVIDYCKDYVGSPVATVATSPTGGAGPAAKAPKAPCHAFAPCDQPSLHNPAL